MSKDSILNLLSSGNLDPQDLENISLEDLSNALMFLYERAATLQDIPPQGLNPSYRMAWVELNHRLNALNKDKNEDCSIDQVLNVLLGPDKRLDSVYLIFELIREYFEQLNALIYIMKKTPDSGVSVINYLQSILNALEEKEGSVPYKAPFILGITKIKEAQELLKAINYPSNLSTMMPIGPVQ